MSTDTPILMRDLDPSVRPREKAMRDGLDSLSDAELMAIVFATGMQGKNVVQLSEDILRDNRGHLSRLMRMSVKDMCRRYKGIGPAKALTLLAALKLGERTVADAVRDDDTQLLSSAGAYGYMAPRLAPLGPVPQPQQPCNLRAAHWPGRSVGHARGRAPARERRIGGTRIVHHRIPQPPVGQSATQPAGHLAHKEDTRRSSPFRHQAQRPHNSGIRLILFLSRRRHHLRGCRFVQPLK